MGNFLATSGKIISPDRIILVDERNKNTIALEWNHYLVIPSRRKVSMIATFDNGNSVAILNPEQVRALPYSNREAVVTLPIVPAETITKEEIRAQLR